MNQSTQYAVKLTPDGTVLYHVRKICDSAEMTASGLTVISAQDYQTLSASTLHHKAAVDPVTKAITFTAIKPAFNIKQARIAATRKIEREAEAARTATFKTPGKIMAFNELVTEAKEFLAKYPTPVPAALAPAADWPLLEAAAISVAPNLTLFAQAIAVIAQQKAWKLAIIAIEKQRKAAMDAIANPAITPAQMTVATAITWTQA